MTGQRKMSSRLWPQRLALVPSHREPWSKDCSALALAAPRAGCVTSQERQVLLSGGQSSVEEDSC